MEFLSEDNIAGQTLLRLVARGSAIIAELLRLSDHVPPVFLGSDQIEAAKYAPILFDFRYLKTPEAYDEKIDSNLDHVELDEEFRENNLGLLERFYKLFDSILKYVKDFITYFDELIDGVFVQHTVESVLQDVEGRQLMCEALYLYGVMLLLMDMRIPGVARERMIVSYYRYKGAAQVQNIDDVCKLCRTTGLVLGPQPVRPQNYPEQYFERFPVQKALVEMIVARLRSDDIYNRNAAYPAPEDRSTALAAQSAMLYVILYFAPHILHTKQAVMREIVDKHFNDNWVIPFYMGYIVDLSEAWLPYAAAKAALNNILDKANVQQFAARHVQSMQRLSVELPKYLTEGVLVEEYVLDNIRPLMTCVRTCNVSLRWVFLHTNTSNKKLKEIVVKIFDVQGLLTLLLQTAQFEFILKELFQGLLKGKQSRWEDCKKECSARMIELAQYFSGQVALARVTKNEKLQNWFTQLSGEVEKLDYANATAAGRKITSLIQALQDVEEFHQIETNLQVKQFLADTRGYLTKMIRTANVRDRILADLDIISDLSYAWEIIGDFTPLIHQRIKAQPNTVLRLRATFLKLASILAVPLVRITQADSKDAVSVAEYYSSALVSYVRKVLEIIPRSVFYLLDQITQLQASSHLTKMPMKVERASLKDFAQLEERYKLAQATHQVSVFTQGILNMKTTLVGIIQLDPKQLLEDGIRKQLVQQMCVAMNEILIFKTGKLEDFEGRITALGQRLDGLRASIEYIQDYINMYGLKIWQEELSRIINYYVEQESNLFLKKQVYDWQSVYQSEAIPIPKFPRVADKANNQQLSDNFMGRMVRELLQLTDPRKTVFVDAMQGWYDQANKEVVGIRTFDLLNRGVGVFGLTGMDKLICFMIVRDLQAFLRMYRKIMDQHTRKFINTMTNQLHPTTQFPADPFRQYKGAVDVAGKLWPIFLEFVTKIGQAQLLRRQIANELNFSCKLDSKILSCTLEVMNDGLLADVEAHYAKPDTKPYPGNEILADVTKYLDTAGICDPMTKIYITSEPLEGIPLMMFLFVLSQMPKLQWDQNFSTLVNRDKNEPLDGPPLVVGMVTLLKQFHSSYTTTFLAYMGQYVRSCVSAHASKGNVTSFPPEVVLVLLFLEEFCRFSHIPRTIVESYVPPYVFDRFNHAGPVPA